MGGTVYTLVGLKGAAVGVAVIMIYKLCIMNCALCINCVSAPEP